MCFVTAAGSFGGRMHEGAIRSRSPVYTTRPNPSYRIMGRAASRPDYTYNDRTAGKIIRGAALITLSGDNAI
jgi:hypothetical protein